MSLLLSLICLNVTAILHPSLEQTCFADPSGNPVNQKQHNQRYHRLEQTDSGGIAVLHSLKADTIDVCGNNIRGWWIYWEYLPEGSESLSPNFKDFNEAYFDLFDENKFEQFIDLCEESILKVLQKLK